MASGDTNGTEDFAVKSAGQDDKFPEGGARAWSVAVGTAGVTFCTFGYVNTFGYACSAP
jgi:hypothetical protein